MSDGAPSAKRARPSSAESPANKVASPNNDRAEQPDIDDAQDDNDVLDFVAEHTTLALQNAWQVEKACDVALRLKRHTAAMQPMRDEVERQRLRLLIGVVAEQEKKAGSPEALGPWQQHVRISAGNRDVADAASPRSPAEADDILSDEDDQFAVDVSTDVTSILHSVVIRHKVCCSCFAACT